jgi:hypothetical protein
MSAVEKYAMRQVEMLTPGVYLLLDDASADRLERLLSMATNGAIEDIHRFCLCFERASMGLFFLPGEHWTHEFKKRLGELFRLCDIRITTGTQGAVSQWDRDNPPQNPEPKRGRRHG